MNKIVLVGRLGRDPETKSTISGAHISTFSLATDDGYGDKKQTNWHTVVTFGKTADSVGQYLSKGSLVGVEGHVQYRSWDKKDGSGKAYATEVVADRVEFLSTGEKTESSGQTEDEDSIPF